MKYVVGLSGGVDSAVAAYLLKQKGAEVIGVTMLQYAEDASSYENIVTDAAKVAEFLGIEHVVTDVCDRFMQEIIQYFSSEYLCGRTPNPCIFCNPLMKWDVLYTAMSKFGADRLATGHYADIVKLHNGRVTLRRDNGRKDQTYALCRLSQLQLQSTFMPLAGMEKEEVRMIAESVGIPVAHKADSQDICFVENGKYAEFIKALHPEAVNAFTEGDFVDEVGNVLGKHKGYAYYTIGQRKGLNLALNRPVFVKKIEPDTNRVVISTQSDVYSTGLMCNQLVCMMSDGIEDGKALRAKIRYAGSLQDCTVYVMDKDLLQVDFAEPIRAITPGQAIVFYENDLLYASGIITA